jgi:tetratricopeptide (TPR) repeat protein
MGDHDAAIVNLVDALEVASKPISHTRHGTHRLQIDVPTLRGDLAVSMSPRRDELGMREVLLELGESHMLAGDPEAATARFGEACELLHSRPSPAHAHALRRLAAAALATGDLARAEQVHAQAHAMANELGDPWWAAHSAHAIGRDLDLAGEPRAADWYRRALESIDRLETPHDWPGHGWVEPLSALALGVIQSRGDPVAAAHSFERALRTCSAPLRAVAEYNLAVTLDSSDPVRSRELLESVLAADDPRVSPAAAHNLALMLRSTDGKRARTLLMQAAASTHPEAAPKARASLLALDMAPTPP